jgi:hypothetical protein
MGKSGRVNQNEIGVMAAFMEFVDQRVLSIALKKIQLVTGISGQGLQAILDISEGICTIMLRLARPQQIEIGAVQHKNVRHDDPYKAVKNQLGRIVHQQGVNVQLSKIKGRLLSLFSSKWRLSLSFH